MIYRIYLRKSVKNNIPKIPKILANNIVNPNAVKTFIVSRMSSKSRPYGSLNSGFFTSCLISLTTIESLNVRNHSTNIRRQIADTIPKIPKDITEVR